jgi:hypothetical protein
MRFHLDGIGRYYYSDRGFNSVPGWFHKPDLQMFDAVLHSQNQADIHGDLLEIGCYQGKATIAMGFGLRPDERIFVCDPFAMTGALGVHEDGLRDQLAQGDAPVYDASRIQF